MNFSKSPPHHLLGRIKRAPLLSKCFLNVLPCRKQCTCGGRQFNQEVLLANEVQHTEGGTFRAASSPSAAWVETVS